ncbi:MAG: TIGR01459 family HAD-type hydrolase [Bosea sp. (in: a-proteobacteria)]
MNDLVANTSGKPELVSAFRDLSSTIDVLICDVWGVVHNGQKAHMAAVAALETFRAAGGTVIMVSNSPRPSVDVIPQLLGYGVSTKTFDRIITSGDLTREMVIARAGQSVVHLGPNRDHTLFAGLDVSFASAETADYFICTGFTDDETETPADYAKTLEVMAKRGLLMICANPDLIVERGHKLIPCAGAMAQAYEKLGGKTVYAGKPYLPVYQQALALASEVSGKAADLSRVAAVGDAIRTDIAGASALGVRSILLLDGIHWGDVGRENWHSDYETWLAKQAFQPTYVMTRLVW